MHPLLVALVEQVQLLVQLAYINEIANETPQKHFEVTIVSIPANPKQT
jgi:hypothetical protein